jgi:hypothetical protein
MTTINQESWNDRDSQFGNNETSRQTNENLNNDGPLSSDRAADSNPLKGEYDAGDEDDETLNDDDINGRDLDTDNGDEWDEANLSDDDLEDDDLDDDDEANFDAHQVKNDKFGSLASSAQNGGDPEPDEIPEEHESDNELDYPDDDKLEQGTDDEVSYKENTEVESPNQTEAPDEKHSTLGNLDSTFTDQSHGRSSGRMIDHEPGSHGVDGPANL